MPEISVIVPVYNVKDYLEKSVGSVLKQSFTDYELILVDDGSTDGSGEIADKIKADNPDRDIKVIRQQNKGLGGARNTGIEAAVGEYLFFVDSDDTVADGCLAELDRYIKENNADIIFFDFIKVDENGKEIYYQKSYSNDGGSFSLDSSKDMLLIPPAAWNKIFRRSLFTESGIRFPERLWFEDLATTVNIYTFSKKNGYIPKPFYLYLQRGGSIMNSPNCDRNIEIITAVDIVLDYYKKNGLFEKFYDELEYLAAFHIYYLSSIRVMRIDKKHKLLDTYKSYMTENFPNFENNKYVSEKEKIIMKLLDRKMYGAVELTFKVKGVLNSIVK